MRNIFSRLKKSRGSAASGSSGPHALENTGERVIPEDARKGFARINLVRHKVAHLYAIREIRAAERVLDVGCGTGYGSAMMAARMGEVVGIDSSPETISWARSKHRAENLKFLAMPATALNFPDGHFDAAYSIQVIEHIEDIDLVLAEVVRVLRPGGKFIVATPNRVTYSPEGMHNIYHVREYSAEELEILLATFFPETRVNGLHAGLDLALRPEVAQREYGARIRALRAALENAPQELRDFIDEWLVEDGFADFDPAVVGPHSFPISPKSIETSLDLLAVCRKAEA